MGEQHPTGSGCVDAFHLHRQLEALLPVLFGGIQVIPLVADTGQAKIRFAGSRPRRITCQVQDAPVALGRQRELVFCFLYLAQTGCSRYGIDGIPKRLTDRYDFGIGPAGRGTVSPSARPGYTWPRETPPLDWRCSNHGAVR